MVASLKFSIDENGEVHVSVEGAEGKSCEGLTEPFEAALGVVAKREYKDSYYATSETEAIAEEGTGR